MAQTLKDCKKIVAACKDNNIILAVGHVLRYTPRYRKVTEIIESGKIGKSRNPLEHVMIFLSISQGLKHWRRMFLKSVFESTPVGHAHS